MKTLAKNKTSLTAIIVALIACFAIGATCLVSSAFADNSDATDAQTCTATAKITATFDSDGNITIPNTELKNDTNYVVTVKSVTTSSDIYSIIKDWTNDFKENTTINPGESLTIKWSANSKVPTSFDGSTEVHVGTITYHYTLKKELPDNIALDSVECTYDGGAQTPEVKGLEDLVEGSDYTLSYENNINAGEATVTVTGIGYYAGSVKELTFTINPASINGAKIATKELTYNGTEQSAIVTSVTLGGKELSLGSDYTVVSGNTGKNAATYNTLTIQGTGNYTDTAIGSFTIKKLDISNADVAITTNPKDTTYTGNTITATVDDITLSGVTFQDGDWAVDTDNSQLKGTNADTYYVYVNGSNNCTGTAKGSWTIGPNSLDKAEITVVNPTYNGEEQNITPVVKLGNTTLIEGTDYKIADGCDTKATNVSTSGYRFKVTGIGNYSGEKTKSWNIDPANIAGAEIATEELTYNGSEQTAVITSVILNGKELSLGSDYTVISGNKGTDVKTYNALTIEGIGNYTGTNNQGSWTIAKAPITVSGITASNKTYDGDTNATLGYGSATLTGCIDADKSKLSVTATGTFDSKDVGTGKTVTISNLALSGDATVLANYELASTGQQTSTTANITAREVTVTWNPSEEASYLYDGSTRTPTATIGNVVDGESLSATLTYKDSSGTTLSSAPSAIGTYTATVAGLTDATGTTASNYALPATELTKSFSIVERSGYWLAAAGADDPEAVVYKGQSQIDEDMAVLHGTKAQTSAGKDKTAVTMEYTNYMNGTTKTTDGKEIRLYTKWYGNTQDESSIYGQPTNQWVEFRIIQVGEHDGDGSAVTFMATHSLPAAKAMNSSGSNAGGWYASDMRGCMTSYVEAGLPDLASAVKAVNKRTIYRSSESGPWSTTSANSITSDRFWLLSIKELTGSEQDEGSQYAWCKSNSITHAAYNSVIADMNTTRAGNRPYRARLLCWWVRSPNTINPYFDYFYFGCVDSGGRPDINGSSTTNLYGVVPAFAM